MSSRNISAQTSILLICHFNIMIISDAIGRLSAGIIDGHEKTAFRCLFAVHVHKLNITLHQE